MAQKKIEVIPAANGYLIRNDLPVDVVCLVMARDATGNILSWANMMLGSGKSQAFKSVNGAVVRVEELEIIHLGVPRNRLPSVSNARSVPRSGNDPEETKRMLRELEISESGVGADKITIAAQQAQLFLEQKNDELNTFRNDPYRKELEYQAFTATQTYPERLKFTQEGNERKRTEFVEDIANMALAYSMIVEARLDVIRKERDLYYPLYQNAKTALEFIKQDRKNFDVLSVAGVDFLSITAKFLESLPSNSDSAQQISIKGEPSRVSKEASDVKDLIQLQIDAPQSLSVILAETTFNEGGKQKTVFRRIGKTDKWVAQIYWTLSANSATFRVMMPGRSEWKDLPSSVNPGRKSLKETLSLAEKSMKIVIKKFKESDFRAEGADEIKTTPIP